MSARVTPVSAAKTLCVMGGLASAIAGVTLLPYAALRPVGWAWLANALVCAATFVLLLSRTRWSTFEAQALAMLVIASTLVTQTYSDWTEAATEAHVAAFEGFKIAALVVAIVVPFRVPIVYATIGICAALPVVYWVLMPPQLRQALPVEEPWNTVMYPVIATAILVFRLRGFALEREVIRAKAEKEALERFAKVLLAYRDLANSPLQSIELIKSLLREEHPEAAHLTEELDRSLERLKALAAMLATRDAHVHWTSKEEAFDPAQIIREYEARRG